MRPKNSLTNSEFEQLSLRLTRWSPMTIAVARALLVDNASREEVARRYRLSPARVLEIRARAQKAWSAVPPHWLAVETWVPVHMKPQLYSLQEALCRRAGEPALSLEWRITSDVQEH